MAKFKGGDSFKRKGLASEVKFPKMNLRVRLMIGRLLVTSSKLF